MVKLRFDHTSIVVSDMQATIEFFSALGMELMGEATIEDESAARVSNLENLRCTIAMMKTPDGSGQLEFCQYHSPVAISPEPENAPANTLGYRSIMFEVDDIDAMVQRLTPLGGGLVGESVQYENSYRLAYLRGPEGVIVALAQSTG